MLSWRHGRRQARALLAVALLGCLLMEQQTAASPERTKTGKGPERHGNPEAGRNVDPKTLRLKSEKTPAKAIRAGHPGTGMFPTKTLTHQELTDTLAYLAVLREEGHRSGDVGSARAVQKTDSSDSESKPPAGNSIRGEQLYQASCVVCHGSQAMGGIGPRLAGNPVLSNDQAFWTIVHEGRHVMPPLKGAVTDEQMIDIRAWLRTLP